MLNTLTFPFPGVVLVVNGTRDRHYLSYLLLKGLKSSSAMVNFYRSICLRTASLFGLKSVGMSAKASERSMKEITLVPLRRRK